MIFSDKSVFAAVLFFHSLPVNLTVLGFLYGIHECHILRFFVPCDFSGHEFGQFLRVRSFARFQNAYGLDRLAPFFIGHTYDTYFGNLFVFENRFFHLYRVNVFPPPVL